MICYSSSGTSPSEASLTPGHLGEVLVSTAHSGGAPQGLGAATWGGGGGGEGWSGRPLSAWLESRSLKTLVRVGTWGPGLGHQLQVMPDNSIRRSETLQSVEAPRRPGSQPSSVISSLAAGRNPTFLLWLLLYTSLYSESRVMSLLHFRTSCILEV